MSDTIELATTALPSIKTGEGLNKTPDVSSLVKKTDYSTQISDIEKKYLTTSDYNKYTKDIVNAKIRQKELARKSIIYNIVKKSDLNTKLAALATKIKLKAE